MKNCDCRVEGHLDIRICGDCDECGAEGHRNLNKCDYCGIKTCEKCDLFYISMMTNYSTICWDCVVTKLSSILKQNILDAAFSNCNFRKFISYLKRHKLKLENKKVICMCRYYWEDFCDMCVTTLCGKCNSCTSFSWHYTNFSDICSKCVLQLKYIPESLENIFAYNFSVLLKKLNEVDDLFKFSDAREYKKVSNLSLKLKVFLNGRLPYKYVQMEVLERGCTLKPEEIIEIV